MSTSQQRNWLRSGRAALGLLVMALLGLLVAQACTPSAQAIRGGGQEATIGVNVGDLAPDFTLTDLEGNLLRLSDLRGKVVFVNFWTQWCPSCRAEMPEIEAVYQEYKDKGVVVIGVDILTSEIFKGYDENDVRQYVQQGGYSWTFVLDTTGEVTANYQVIKIPTSFFIDREGIIQAWKRGAMTKRAIEVELEKAMR